MSQQLAYEMTYSSRLAVSLLILLWACTFLADECRGDLKEKLPERVVVLTFDDSCKSHFTFVRPLLKELGFSATFFITEGFEFKTNKKDYMTWEQIRKLHDDGFEIGNHTRDHMTVAEHTLSELKIQIQHINKQCRAYGIPQPVSFAYPGNGFHLGALPILETQGFRFARRGGSPEYTYEEGGGVAYRLGEDHPLLVPSIGDARPNWTIKDFRTALARANEGEIAVLQFHGVPDRAHPWVSTPRKRFEEYMRYLKKNKYEVLAMRDLERFVDPSEKPADPNRVIRERMKRIEATRQK